MKTVHETSVAALFVGWLLVSGCTGSASAPAVSTASKKHPTNSLPDALTLTADISERVPVLYLTKSEFSSIPQGDERKLMMMFARTDTAGRSPNFLTLVAYPSHERKFVGARLFLHNDVMKWPLTFDSSPTNVLTAQKLGKNQLARILQVLNASVSSAPVVAFFPKRDDKGHIFFEVFVYDSREAITAVELLPPSKITDTNPSPPAKEGNASGQ